MILQAVTILFFSLALVMALIVIAATLHGERAAVMRALGLRPASRPIVRPVRIRPARRAVMLRMPPVAPRCAAA